MLKKITDRAQRPQSKKWAHQTGIRKCAENYGLSFLSQKFDAMLHFSWLIFEPDPARPNTAKNMSARFGERGKMAKIQVWPMPLEPRAELIILGGTKQDKSRALFCMLLPDDGSCYTAAEVVKQALPHAEQLDDYRNHAKALYDLANDKGITGKREGDPGPDNVDASGKLLLGKRGHKQRPRWNARSWHAIISDEIWAWLIEFNLDLKRRVEAHHREGFTVRLYCDMEFFHITEERGVALNPKKEQQLDVQVECPGMSVKLQAESGQVSQKERKSKPPVTWLANIFHHWRSHHLLFLALFVSVAIMILMLKWQQTWNTKPQLNKAKEPTVNDLTKDQSTANNFGYIAAKKELSGIQVSGPNAVQSNFQQNLDIGWIYYNNGRYREAVDVANSLFANMESSEKEKTYALHLRGYGLSKLRRFDDARADFDLAKAGFETLHAGELKKTSSHRYLGFAGFVALMDVAKAKTFIDDHHLDEAEKILTQTQAPSNPQHLGYTRCVESRLAFLKGKYLVAIERAGEALDAYRKAKDVKGELNALSELGLAQLVWAHQQGTSYDEGLKNSRPALKMAIDQKELNKIYFSMINLVFYEEVSNQRSGKKDLINLYIQEAKDTELSDLYGLAMELAHKQKIPGN